ncbi:hypothetical protein Glove_86g191 [Diversispora epigaea]|uniref:Uncharacterized protein n=1 Tax=Diversispora epigaea TaxID=1348612 RepID=A0A397JG34_9GLOM|nr:hypothetical protein Glove_86g191 [Diversispora epigaea]
MAFACPFCNRVLSNRSAYSQHVKRCSENYASSSSEEIFIQNESDIIMSEQEDNSKDNRNNEIIYISDNESRSSPRSNRINDIIQIEIDERPQNIDSLTFEEHASIQYEEPASREPEFETEESKFESDETESESDETESKSDKTEFESDKTDNESDESEEFESAEEETETIPKFPNNTYSDLMTLIIQHNLNNKAENAIIHVKQLLAYLPIIKAKDDTQKKSEEHKNIVRRTFHKSLKFLLSPLYNEDNGIELELNNRILWCIPRISMIISDWPEACTFSLTYKSTQSNHPCHFCLVSKENLSNINLNSNQIEPRSHKNMKLHYKNNTEKNVSIEKVQNFFWNVPDINIYAATVPDRMHHLDLSLFHYQLSFTKALILEQCGKSFIDKMNNRIKLISHYQDLKSFSNGFLHLTLLTASEYRSLMKIMIFIVDNLYQDSKRPNFIKNNKITEIYLKWNKMYLLSRKENYEESDITQYSSSKLQFPKLHSWVFHICSSIREFGAINGYTTETYESLHKDYVKKPYKLTNKKEIEKQIMKIIRCKAIIIESSSKEIPKTPIALKYSKKLYEFCIQNAEIYIQTRMNDPDLEKEMKLGFEKFLECLDAYLDFYDKKLSEHEEIDIKFRIYSGVTLKYGAKMRANNKFHKRPIFSNIAVEMNPDEIFEYTSDNGVCFAQVLLITEIIMNYEEPMHLALVQWYDFKSSVNPYLYECPLLEKTNIFNLIEIEVINDIIHIIPRFNIDNEFLVNKFLF